jgi:hypothetical protein
VKNSLHPQNVASQVFSKVFEKKNGATGSDFIADGLSGLAARFVKKVAEKAEEKIGKWFKK